MLRRHVLVRVLDDNKTFPSVTKGEAVACCVSGIHSFINLLVTNHCSVCHGEQHIHVYVKIRDSPTLRIVSWVCFPMHVFFSLNAC